jgi:hypothetical protein
MNIIKYAFSAPTHDLIQVYNYKTTAGRKKKMRKKEMNVKI